MKYDKNEKNNLPEAIRRKRQADEMWDRVISSPLSVDILFSAMDNCDRADVLLMKEEAKARGRKIYLDHRDLKPDRLQDNRMEFDREFILKVLNEMISQKEV